MVQRTMELFEAIRRDDLASLVMCLHDDVLHCLVPDDTPQILLDKPYPIMVAAYYGSIRCFTYLASKGQDKKLDSKNRHTFHFAAAGGNMVIFQFLKAKIDSYYDIFDEFGNTPLHYAAKYARTAIVQIMCLENVPIVVKNVFGWLPSHFAAATGNSRILKMLNEAGDDMTSVNEAGWTPLHFAIKYKHPDCIDYLLKINAILLSDFNQMISVAHLAAATNDFNTLITILEMGEDQNVHNHNNWTMLHFAAANGNANLISAVQHLLSELSFRKIDRKKRTMLHIAAISGHLNIIQMLEQYDLAKEIDIYNRTALHYAVEYNHLDCVEYLMKIIPITFDKYQQSPLHIAAAKGNFDIMSALLQTKDFQLNQYDLYGMTPFHYIIRNNHKHLIDLLLENGADPKLLTKEYKSSMTFAVINNNMNLIERFVQMGEFPVFTPDDRGWTPVHYATQLGKRKIINYFFDLDLNCIRTVTKLKQTVLHIAVETNQNKALTFFINMGISFNERDIYGNTPLHIAVKLNHAGMVRNMVDQTDSDVKLQNNIGQTPLHLAILNWNIDILKYISLNAECDFDISDCDGYTPFILASKLGQSNTIIFLLSQTSLDFNKADKNGDTAIHHAARLKCKKVIELLFNSGHFDFEHRNNDGFRPIDIARNQVSEEIVYYLSQQFPQYQREFDPKDEQVEEEEEEDIEEEETSEHPEESAFDENFVHRSSSDSSESSDLILVMQQTKPKKKAGSCPKPKHETESLPNSPDTD